MGPQTILKADIQWAKLRESGFQAIPCPHCGTSDYSDVSSILINWPDVP